MRPKKWREFQHYQNGRQTVWIKNYLDLDEPGSKFSRLSFADQGRLQRLWRTCARSPHDGMIAYDEQSIRAQLGDKRFPVASHLVTTWFHIGTQLDLKRAAKREERASKRIANA